MTNTKRGTSNTNDRGSAAQRRVRKAWLVQTYRADVDLLINTLRLVVSDGVEVAVVEQRRPGTHTEVPLGEGVPACRCYRCGALLTVETVTVDRIIPGCQGGTYRRNNIRPACGYCNSSTGARLGHKRKENAA